MDDGGEGSGRGALQLSESCEMELGRCMVKSTWVVRGFFC